MKPIDSDESIDWAISDKKYAERCLFKIKKEVAKLKEENARLKRILEESENRDKVYD